MGLESTVTKMMSSKFVVVSSSSANCCAELEFTLERSVFPIPLAWRYQSRTSVEALSQHSSVSPDTMLVAPPFLMEPLGQVRAEQV